MDLLRAEKDRGGITVSKDLQVVRRGDKVYFVRSGEKVVMKYENSGLFSKKKERSIDVAFPVVHGTNCEDGTMQGYFEYLGIPYVGCDILSSAVGMDKAVFKDVVKRAGVPVLDSIEIRAREYTSGST